MIHRLHWGGEIQIIPSSLLEGVRLDGPSLADQTLPYIPSCPDLDDEVQTLHTLARSGVITAEVAERQLNTYLLVAGHEHMSLIPIPTRRRWLMLPIADAPHFSLLPDLGQTIHDVLIRQPITSALEAVIQQSIPLVRHAKHMPQFNDSQDILLNLILALLLGLFPGTPRKPGFTVRARLFARVHVLLTSSREVQTAFLTRNQDVLLLACMEYIARVVPVYMPVQGYFLTDQDTPSAMFFRRIPPLGDDLRQTIDEQSQSLDTPSWEMIQGTCSAMVERVSRLKRMHANPPPKNLPPPSALIPTPDPLTYWDAPQLLGNPTSDEFRLLGLSLGLHGSILMQIQQNIQVWTLPHNLYKMQCDRLKTLCCDDNRSAYLRTRRSIVAHILVFFLFRHVTPVHNNRSICTNCMLVLKTTPHTRLRLDTLSHNLVCATCVHGGLVSVNLLGRILRFRKQFFYFCPSCMQIQQYNGGGEQPWLADWHGERESKCIHTTGEDVHPTRHKHKCFICSESAMAHVVERVDHMTGEMVTFHYCQRHMPHTEALIKCINARRMAGNPPFSRRGPRDPPLQ